MVLGPEIIPALARMGHLALRWSLDPLPGSRLQASSHTSAGPCIP